MTASWIAWVVAASDSSASAAASGRTTYTFGGVVWTCRAAAASSRPLRSRGTMPRIRSTTKRPSAAMPAATIVRVRARRGGRSLVSMLVTKVRGWLAAQQAVGQGHEEQGVERRHHQPADDRPAQRRVLLAALAEAQAHRQHAEEHRQRRHEDGAQPRTAGGERGRPRIVTAELRMAMLVGERDHLDAVRRRHSDRP